MSQFLHAQGLKLIGSAQRSAFVLLATAFLPFLGIPVLWVGMVVLALFTLEHGARASLFPLFALMLPGICFSISMGSVLWLQMLIPIILVFSLALLFRRTHSWSMLVEVSVLIAIVLVLIVHLIVPDVSAWWMRVIKTLFQNSSLAKLMGVDQSSHLVSIDQFSRLATGFQVSGDVLLGGMNVLIASFWLDGLHGVTRLRNGWKTLRISWALLGVTCLLGVAAALGSAFALDALPILAVVFALIGLSILRAVMPTFCKKKIRLWILLVLVFLTSPYSMIILFVIGLSDRFADWRSQFKRIKKSQNKGK